MKTILVAIDSAPLARDVLETAAELARGTGAQLVLLHAGDVAGAIGEVATGIDGQRFTERIMGELRQRLETARREFRLPEETRLRVDVGDATRALLTAIAEERPDLAVLGARGFGSPEGPLGRVTYDVLHRAACSVLVVRPKG